MAENTIERSAEQQRLFELSGSVKSSDHLVIFLYLLMKVHLPLGTATEVVYDELKQRGDGPQRESQVNAICDRLISQKLLSVEQLSKLQSDLEATRGKECSFTNGWLANYASYLAGLLTSKPSGHPPLCS